MPQKGQITKHEWEYAYTQGDVVVYQCKYCPTKKMCSNARPIYSNENYNHLLGIPPKCITRKTQTDEQVQIGH